MKEMIKLTQDDFGLLANCAVRYCFGRQTYMPSSIMKIVITHLSEFDDRTIGCMERDVREALNNHKSGLMSIGDSKIDLPDWEQFYSMLNAEVEKRKIRRWG